MGEYLGPDSARSEKYNVSPLTAIKFLMSDGSIVDSIDQSQNIVSPANAALAELYGEMPFIPAKFLMSDGSIVATMYGTGSQLTQYVDYTGSDTILTANMYGQTHNITDAGTLTCEDFKKGMKFRVICDVAEIVVVQCAAASKFVFDLTLRALGGKLTSDGSAYSELLIYCDADGVGKAYPAAGVWTYSA